MFGWTYLWFGVLVAALQKVDANNFTGNLTEGDTLLLSEVLEDSLLASYNQCEAIVLNGGFLTFGNTTDNNYTLNYPNIFITCAGEGDSEHNGSTIMMNMKAILAGSTIKHNTESLVAKDNFEDSILIIAFASCAVCIGTWMVYLVLMLLPRESRLGRSLLVPFYVLFCAFYDTAMLAKTIQTILQDQYRDNVQNFCAYEQRIIDSTAFKVGSIMANVLLYLNWTMIIYYMFHDKRKIIMGWLRPILASRNKLIIVVGLSLTAIDTILLALMYQSRFPGLRIALTVVDFIIYVLFCGLTHFFVWHDFRFILAPQRMHFTKGNQVKKLLSLIWNDYHETIPLLIYNIALFGLLFFTKIYFTIDYSPSHRWKFKIVKFLQLIITVSVWGLISVLEKRELILSKQTVLGRKISDDDEYFFDPRLSSRHRNAASEEENTITGSPRGGADNSEYNLRCGTPLIKPLKVWKSHMERPKNLRKISRTTGKKLLNALIGLNNNETLGEDVALAERRSNATPRSSTRGSMESVRDYNAKVSIDTTLNFELTHSAERASVETELARNYIYEYDNND